MGTGIEREKFERGEGPSRSCPTALLQPVTLRGPRPLAALQDHRPPVAVVLCPPPPPPASSPCFSRSRNPLLPSPTPLCLSRAAPSSPLSSRPLPCPPQAQLTTLHCLPLKMPLWPRGSPFSPGSHRLTHTHPLPRAASGAGRPAAEGSADAGPGRGRESPAAARSRRSTWPETSGAGSSRVPGTPAATGPGDSAGAGSRLRGIRTAPRERPPLEAKGSESPTDGGRGPHRGAASALAGSVPLWGQGPLKGRSEWLLLWRPPHLKSPPPRGPSRRRR